MSYHYVCIIQLGNRSICKCYDCKILIIKPFEFYATGQISPINPDIRIFIGNIYQNNSIIAIDVMRFIIILILFLFVIIEIIEKFPKFREDFFGTLNIKIFYSMFLLIVFLVNILNRIYYLNKNIKNLNSFNTNNYSVKIYFLFSMIHLKLQKHFT